jgi:hypothetical protein
MYFNPTRTKKVTLVRYFTNIIGFGSVLLIEVGAKKIIRNNPACLLPKKF